MLKTKLFPIVLAILVMAAGSSASVADHRHHGRHYGGGYHSFHGHPGFSFYFGVPLFPRPYYSYPYYPPAGRGDGAFQAAALHRT
ncbi:hypothetical protein [Methylomonas sp. LL1]|uniref:hypothetical protein n=1 Tax=Methylomonas sp. LL1 TaxID=2785785 RepID=UPI001E337065|nr:hypothetical protein [Methylomonas sp. LL1]